MKTDLRSRHFYHNKYTRIKAHFLTFVTALLLPRVLERKIADKSVDNKRYGGGGFLPSLVKLVFNDEKFVCYKIFFSFGKLFC